MYDMGRVVKAYNLGVVSSNPDLGSKSPPPVSQEGWGGGGGGGECDTVSTFSHETHCQGMARHAESRNK